MTHGWIAGALFYFLFFTLNRTIVIQLDKKRRDMSPSIIKINAQVAADSFNIEPKQIICVKADGNYAVFYISENKEVKEKMVRQTLDNIERQLVQSAGFVRSHRAYIINKHFLLKKSGNAAGLQLSLKNLPFHVPVSRSRIKDFHELTAPV
jgi:DNA-binding LytR/AlgR family response regulator